MPTANADTCQQHLQDLGGTEAQLNPGTHTHSWSKLECPAPVTCINPPDVFEHPVLITHPQAEQELLMGLPCDPQLGTKQSKVERLCDVKTSATHPEIAAGPCDGVDRYIHKCTDGCV